MADIFFLQVPVLGTKFIFFNGIFFAGAANILFGLLDMAENTLTFTLLSFLVRIFEALGAAAFSTASYTIVLNLYPEHISTVFGIMETCVGVGMSLGPAIGGALYSVGGFGLPFYILGTCVLITLPTCWILMRGIQGARFLSSSPSCLSLTFASFCFLLTKLLTYFNAPEIEATKAEVGLPKRGDRSHSAPDVRDS